MPQLRGGKSAKPRKEKFFVRVQAPDETVQFFNATEYIGQPMPFQKPQATCAFRPGDDTVAFSLLHLTKRTAANIAAAPIEIPRGPLARLERKAKSFGDLADTEIIVELTLRKRVERSEEELAALAAAAAAPVAEGEEAPARPPRPAPEVTVEVHKLVLKRDDNGVATLEMPDFGEDPSFELPGGAVQLSLFFRSPKVARNIAVGFIGHIGKPETAESVVRAASMVLFSLSQLAEFRILSGIETVHVPAAANRWSSASKAPQRKAEDRAQVVVPTWLFSSEFAPLGAGNVAVEVDLENANPASGRLLCHYTPDESLAEAFVAFRTIFDMAIGDFLRLNLGDDELASITYDIVLGDVSSGTIERLQETLSGLRQGIDFTPEQFRAHA